MMNTCISIIKLAMALSFLLLSQGCASLDLHESKILKKDNAERRVVSVEYYKTLREKIDANKIITEKAMQASAEIGKSIGAPLAPESAVSNRQGFVVKGDGKRYDIGKPSPPEQLLPLAQERTKQVVSLTKSMSDVARYSVVDIAAPEGFKVPDGISYDQMPSAKDIDSILDSLPNLMELFPDKNAEKSIEKK